eukprot:1896654-Pyramimonas_sp.AAC.1
MVDADAQERLGEIKKELAHIQNARRKRRTEVEKASKTYAFRGIVEIIREQQLRRDARAPGGISEEWERT